MAKRRIMRSLIIRELSGVDKPAQIGARALIMKRADPEEDEDRELTPEYVADLMKRGKAILTTSDDGHTHLVMLEDFDGNDVVSGTTTWQDEHSHPWIMLENGTILIGEVDEHTHETDRESKLAGDTTMTPEEQSAADALKAENDALKAKNERAEKVLALTAKSKAHFDTLTDEAEQDTFLGKSGDDQDAEVSAIEKAKTDADPIVYTTDAGLELRKSAGVALIEMWKAHDLQAKENAELKKKLEDQDLRKRAEADLEFMPGTIETRMALLKSADEIKDETQRKSAHESLKAQNTAMAEAFKTHGSGNTSPIDGSADDKLNKLAKQYQKDHKDVTFEQAFAKVLDTKEGGELYGKSVN